MGVAGRFGYDDVIAPAETRAILLNTLATLPTPSPRGAQEGDRALLGRS
jgi:hypothetical protein